MLSTPGTRSGRRAGRRTGDLRSTLVVAPPEELSFWRDEAGPVVAAMDELSAAGKGWINLRPDVPDDADPGEPGLFSGSGPAVPLCTWSAGEQRRRRREPASVGVEHACGPKAAARLADLGHPVPPGWPVVQDHSRRGLVVQTPGDAGHPEVLEWLLEAGTRLARVPTTGRWFGAVFRG